MSDPEALSGFLDNGIERLGGLDILVNNAGTAGPTAGGRGIARRLERLPNGQSHQRLSRHSESHPALRAAGGGSIVNLSSAAGKWLPVRSPYSAAKFGIVGFTRTCAMELAPTAFASIVSSRVASRASGSIG